MFNVNDRIRLLAMPDDPCPVPVGTTGTIVSRARVCLDPRHTYTQYGVKWDNGRTLQAVVPPDVLVPE